MNTGCAVKMSQKDQEQEHHSVMVQEVLSGLKLAPNQESQHETSQDGIFVDLTFGRGGHSRAILKCLSPKGRLFSMDRDPAAKPFAESLANTDSRFTFQSQRFSHLRQFCEHYGISGKIHGIVMDLGVSSPQLDEGARGFSFKNQGPLDMRMDPHQGISAAEWINTAQESEIQRVLKDYGEERFYRRITQAILLARGQTPITTTEGLAEIVSRANPAWEKHKHPATRCFQAIRIHINHELEELSHALEQSIPMLALGGRLVVISFHSLEDRIVKRFIQGHEHDQTPRNLPLQMHHWHPVLRSVGKKQKPTDQECFENRRARSAVLRVAEKVGEAV